MYFSFFIFLIQKLLCFQLDFTLENIPKSIIYQTHDDTIYNDYYVYSAKNGYSNEELKIIYQTGNSPYNSQTFPFKYNNEYNLYNNKFSNEDCNSNYISSFLFCKENLNHYFYGYLNIYKTLDDLYTNKKISSKIFGQEYSYDKNKLKIYFGDISTMSKGKYSYKCEINNFNNILLNYITIIQDDDKNKENMTNILINSDTEINSAYNGIKGPYNIGEKIFNLILSFPAFKDKCHLTNIKSISYEDEYLKLICSSDTNIYSLPKMIFSFGKNNQLQLNLFPEMFFYKQYDAFGDKFFFISSIEFSRINNNWVIGRPLLNEVNLIFNLEEKEKYIEFIYNDDKFFYKVNIGNNSGTKKFIIVLLSILGIGITAFALWFVFIYLKKKKKNVKMKDFMESNVQSLNDI
jgi:hypothetical protein